MWNPITLMWNPTQGHAMQQQGAAAVVSSVQAALVASTASLNALEELVTRLQAGEVPSRAALELWRAQIDQMRALLGPIEAAWQQIERLLRAHGERWTERSKLRLDARPGMLLLSEVDLSEGEQPRLLLGADDRDPGTFGRRVELRDVAGTKR
jgi:exonuclease VII small subunit